MVAIDGRDSGNIHAREALLGILDGCPQCHGGFILQHVGDILAVIVGRDELPDNLRRGVLVRVDNTQTGVTRRRQQTQIEVGIHGGRELVVHLREADAVGAVAVRQEGEALVGVIALAAVHIQGIVAGNEQAHDVAGRRAVLDVAGNIVGLAVPLLRLLGLLVYLAVVGIDIDPVAAGGFHAGTGAPVIGSHIEAGSPDVVEITFCSLCQGHSLRGRRLCPTLCPSADTCRQQGCKKS